MNRKALSMFLVLTFTTAWALFLLPILFGEPTSVQRQTVTQLAWMAAMWMPGLAAILVTLLIEKQSLAALGLTRLGNWRAYLWAWLIPPALTVLTGLLTWALGLGELDLTFSQLRAAMEGTGIANPPVETVVLVQVLLGLTFGPLVNVLFTLGEELGWRGFLLPQTLTMGTGKAILLNGLIWGVWHAPAILQGHNYPNHPVAGVFLMIIFTILIGTFISWTYLRTGSVWAPALAHGSLNAIAGLPLLFLSGVDITLAGTISSVLGWLSIAGLVVWLALSGKLKPAWAPPPVPQPTESLSPEFSEG